MYCCERNHDKDPISKLLQKWQRLYVSPPSLLIQPNKLSGSFFGTIYSGCSFAKALTVSQSVGIVSTYSLMEMVQPSIDGLLNYPPFQRCHITLTIFQILFTHHLEGIITNITREFDMWFNTPVNISFVSHCFIHDTHQSNHLPVIIIRI